MSPIIFEAGTQNFDSLGLGLLPNGLKAIVTEGLNGKFTFEMIYPVDGRNYATLQINRIVKVDAGHRLLGQAFVIRQITQNIDMTVSVYAEHISYLSLDMALKPAQTFSNLTAQQALQAWKNHLVDDTPFVMYSDIPTLNNVTFGAPDFENARQALGGHAGSILDVWGGEYEFDNWYIRLWKQRGKVANTVISYGRNLTDLSQETSITDTYTSLYPYMVDKDQVKHFLPELVVDSQYVANYPNRKIMLIDFSSEFGQGESFSETKLRARATSYINSNNVGVPKVSFDVSAVDLSKAVDYTGEPEQIDLADTVSVYFEKLNINATAQVTGVVWNVLSEQYDSFQLGARRASLSSQIATVANDANTTAQQAKETANNAYQLSANGKHIIGYLDSGDPLPDNPKVGDTIFMKDGDDFHILEWDGITWVTKIDPNLSARLEETLETAKTEAAQLIDDNMLSVSSVASSIASEASSLAVQQANFTSVASSYANDALTAANSARASMAISLASSAATQATSTAAALSSAQSAASSVAASMVANGVSNVTSAYKTYTDSAVAVGVNTAKSYADGGISSTATQLNATATSLAASVTTVSSAASGGINSLATQLTATNSSFGASVTSLASKDNTLSTAIGSVAVTASTANVGVTSVASSVNSQISTLSAGLTVTNSQVALRATKSEVNTATGSLATAIGSVDVKADGISQTVSAINAKVNELGQINQLFNTEWSPDFAGWYVGGSTNVVGSLWAPSTPITTNNSYSLAGGKYNGSNVIRRNYGSGTNSMYSDLVAVGGLVALSISLTIYSSSDYPDNGNPVAFYLRFYDADKKFISSQDKNHTKYSDWTVVKFENVVTPSNAAYVSVNLLTNQSVGLSYYAQPMLVFGSKVGAYVQGNYNNNNRLATVEQNVESITNIVSNPTTGLTKRVQTAEGTLTQVQGTDIPALKAATFWQTYSSLNFNDYVSQGSFFFNTTAVKTNGPTTSTAWIYLMVEVGLPASTNGGRIKQTAWYDGAGINTTYVRTLNGGTWTVWIASDNNSLATITTLKDQVTTEISNRITGDNNMLSQAQNYTQSQITSAVSGVNSSLTQTADALLANIGNNNLVTNSEFDPLNAGWYVLPVTGATIGAPVTLSKTDYFYDKQIVNGSTGINYGNNVNGTWLTSEPIRVDANTTFSISILAGRPGTQSQNTTFDFRLGLYDVNKKFITSIGSSNPISGTTFKEIQLYKRENLNVTAETRYVSFILARSSTGNDAIFQPMINFGATALKYSPTYGTSSSSTILSLLKDNWSIGIANNIGNIVSGIAGDSSQMTIISDKVIIKSPNTQITGTAWINSAMIANAAIGTAQIADIAITSAKIASLDVNKLTGNITNFIQSNWNGIYGSVSITSSGMKVSTSGVTTDFNSSGMDLTLSGEFVGGIGVAHMQCMPDNYQGLNFQLNGVGDYMAWAARDNGVQTGNYPAKLVWYRGGSYTKPSGNFSGFTFLDTVTFAEHINVAGGTSQRISFGTNMFNNNPYPYIGDSRGKAGFAYGLTETYLISDNHYYNASKVIRALANLGDWKLPKSINSSGIVTEWYNMNT